MKPEINRDVLHAINYGELFLFVVKPIAIEMHSGKGAEHKYIVYKELTDGQRAAFMYWVLYAHAADELQFYTWIPYMRHPEPNYWNQLRKGMELIGCIEVIQFMNKCETVYSVLEQIKSDWSAFATSDLEKTELKQDIQKLFLEFKELSPRTMEFIGQYIKANAYDFVNITDKD